MAYTLQHQHGKVAWRIFEPFLYIKNEFWENNWVKQGFGILFGLDLIGFWDSQEPTEGVLRVDKAYTW